MSSDQPTKSHRNIGEQIDEIVNDRLDHSLEDILGRIVDRRLEGLLSKQIDKDVSLRIDDNIAERLNHTHMKWLEWTFEDKFMFGSRWILAPAYALLVVVLVALAVTCVFETIQLIRDWKAYDETGTLTQALVIVDIVLVMNLVLMLAFVGYINFVSKIHPSRTEDWPDWTTKLDYSGLKL
jgi:hypothetical protein